MMNQRILLILIIMNLTAPAFGTVARRIGASSPTVGTRELSSRPNAVPRAFKTGAEAEEVAVRMMNDGNYRNAVRLLDRAFKVGNMGDSLEIAKMRWFALRGKAYEKLAGKVIHDPEKKKGLLGKALEDSLAAEAIRVAEKKSGNLPSTSTWRKDGEGRKSLQRRLKRIPRRLGKVEAELSSK